MRTLINPSFIGALTQRRGEQWAWSFRTSFDAIARAGASRHPAVQIPATHRKPSFRRRFTRFPLSRLASVPP